MPLYLVAIAALYFGGLYLLRSSTQTGFGAAYHQQVAGVATPAQLAQPQLYWMMLAVAGALYLTLGVVLLLLTAYGLPGRQPWVWAAAGACGMLSMGLLAVVNLAGQGSRSPWALNLLMLALTALGLWLTWRWHSRAPLA